MLIENTIEGFYESVKKAGANILVAGTAILIAKDLSIEDQNLLSSLLQSIGENLSIIATVQSNCESKNNSK